MLRRKVHQPQSHHTSTPPTIQPETSRPMLQDTGMGVVRHGPFSSSPSSEDTTRHEEKLQLAPIMSLPENDSDGGSLSTGCDLETSDYELINAEPVIDDQHANTVEPVICVAIGRLVDTSTLLTLEELIAVGEEFCRCSLLPLPDPHDFDVGLLLEPDESEIQDHDEAMTAPLIGDTPPTEPSEPGSVMAIVTPGNTSVTPEQLAIWGEDLRFAAHMPMPEDWEDDFADPPVVKPSSLEDPTYKWTRVDAWVEEKDNEGRTMWRNRHVEFVTFLDPSIWRAGYMEREAKLKLVEKVKKNSTLNREPERMAGKEKSWWCLVM